jgi:drug/metabolite transporter (DMT)-like permease
MPSLKGYLLIASSATGFGLMPILAVYAYRDGITVPTLLFLRFGIAAAVFVPYACWPAARQRTSPAAGRDILRLLLLGGVLYAAQSALYFSAVQHISPALAAVLLYLYPALVAAASAALTRRRPPRGVIASVLVSFAGVALVVGRIQWQLSLAGVLEAVGAAVVYTIYILYGDRVGGSVRPVVMTAFIALPASMSFLVYGAVTGTLRLGFTVSGWVPVVTIALVSTVMAILCFFGGLRVIGPTQASISSTLEPVVSIVAAVLLIGGGLTGPQLFGAALVLTGATIGMLSRRAPAAVPA